MSIIRLGFDPGKKGGMAIIDASSWPHGQVQALPLPLAGKEIDAGRISDILEIWCPNPKLVSAYVEKAQAMPKNGATSMFHYGRGYGKILGVLAARRIPYELVTPQAWKKVVLAGTKKDKAAAIRFVRNRWPNVNLMPGECKVPQDGLADALCIAAFGWERGKN